MANSRHYAIVQYVAALLIAGTPVAGGRVYEGLDYAMPPDAASQVHVLLDGIDDPDASLMYPNAPIDWTDHFIVVIKARRSGIDPAEKVADAVWTDVYARVLADRTFGGLLELFTPGGVAPDRDQADTDVALLTWRFTVLHRTTDNSIA
jgi:hypothetical protein